jgi:hypothetical protein
VKEEEERHVDRLLARGRLSRPEKERMLAALLPAAPRRRRRWLWVSAAAPALAAAGLLLMVWPRGQPGGDGFRAKGDGAGPAVTASCASGCRVGSTLAYRIEGAREPLYLAAWTIDGKGVRTWHFPSSSGELPRVAAAGAPVLLPRGVRLGAAGTQTLHWVLLRRPLARQEIVAAATTATAPAATPTSPTTPAASDVAARGELPLAVAP